MLWDKKTIFGLLSIIFLMAMQNGNANVVLIKGKVFDFSTNKPIGTNLILKDPEGAVINIKSNSLDGEYQQVLKPGKKYSVVFEGFKIKSFAPYIETPNSREYIEIIKDFPVEPYQVNDEVFKAILFKTNDSSISEEGILQLKELKEYLKLQKNMNVDVIVNIKDSHFKAKKITTKVQSGKKTINKTITISPNQQAEELAEARLNELKNIFKEIGIRSSGVNFTLDKSMTTPKANPKSKSSKQHIIQENNVIVTVSGFRKL